MKIISLNIWGGTMYEPLMKFIKSQAANTDIFCFQEVFQSETKNLISGGAHMNIFGELVKALPDFEGRFLPLFEGHNLQGRVDFQVYWGEAIFTRKSFAITSAGHNFIYGHYNSALVEDGMWDLPVAIQYVRLNKNDTPLTIVHLHGIVHPGTKVDSLERLEQSKSIITFLSQEAGSKILCGDFNLMPNTESIVMIEKSGMENLIKTFNIKSTRGSLNEKKYPDNPQRFADYFFISPDINVKNFSVPDAEISDHCPLILVI